MRNAATLLSWVILFVVAVFSLPEKSDTFLQDSLDFESRFIRGAKVDAAGVIKPVKRVPGKKPNEHFFTQRAYPFDDIPHEAYRNALQQAQALRADDLSNNSRSGGTWTPSGPSNIGGRITAVDIHPSEPNVILAGAASGGVLRSTNTGATWTFIMDESPSLSIGDLDIDPNDPDHIVVGTGEANASGDSYPGNGVYISSDGGDTWNYRGLPDSRHIGRVEISPANSNHIFVGAMGALYGTNPERGVYRSTDDGYSWEQVLFVSDSTGCIDLAINPNNPAIIYAAMWECRRTTNDRQVGGVTSGIYRSTNGGDDWTLLGSNLPGPAPDVGRIGLSLCASEPEVVYAIYADHPGYFMGIYKTSDNGDNWYRMDHDDIPDVYSSYGWYFGNMRVDPNNSARLYAFGLYVYKSTNSGDSWNEIAYSVHVDHHDWWINPNNSNWMISANDGGLDISTNGGNSWSKLYDLPVSQFYAGEIDYINPERIYGGTQDNGTLRTWTGGVDDWDRILGGDGFYVVVDHTNSNVIYAEYQWGNLYKSTDGGNDFNYAMNGISGSDRRNWSTPVVIDPSNPQTLYYGTYKIYKTTNGSSSWSSISPDLSNGPGSGSLPFGTITTIAVSPSDPDVVYAGVDDGNVWRTLNGGSEWVKISDDLPVRWVTRVAVDPADPLTAYVALSGYREEEFLPHIFRTTDTGATWDDISGNLPEAPINSVVIDPGQSTRLFAGTDVGVYFTNDLGASWAPLGDGMPMITVHELKLHAPTRTLLAATHGRSMYKLNLGTVSVPEQGAARRILRLDSPSPTPFSLMTALRFHLDAGRDVSASVYDVQGRRLKSWDREVYPAGSHSIVWDGRDASGRRMNAGVYWIRLRAGHESRSVRVLLVD